jgi:hypothetical protein
MISPNRGVSWSGASGVSMSEIGGIRTPLSNKRFGERFRENSARATQCVRVCMGYQGSIGLWPAVIVCFRSLESREVELARRVPLTLSRGKELAAHKLTQCIKPDDLEIDVGQRPAPEVPHQPLRSALHTESGPRRIVHVEILSFSKASPQGPMLLFVNLDECAVAVVIDDEVEFYSVWSGARRQNKIAERNQQIKESGRSPRR